MFDKHWTSLFSTCTCFPFQNCSKQLWNSKFESKLSSGWLMACYCLGLEKVVHLKTGAICRQRKDALQCIWFKEFALQTLSSEACISLVCTALLSQALHCVRSRRWNGSERALILHLCTAFSLPGVQCTVYSGKSAGGVFALWDIHIASRLCRRKHAVGNVQCCRTEQQCWKLLGMGGDGQWKVKHATQGQNMQWMRSGIWSSGGSDETHHCSSLW